MSAFYISKNGKKLGPFAEAEVIAKLDSGEFSESDQVMTEGLAGWTALGSLIVREPVSRSTGETMDEWVRAVRNTAGKFSVLSAERPFTTACILLGLGCLVMFLSQWPVLLFGPVFLLALVAAWPMLHQQRIVAAVLFLILSLAIPFLLWERISSRKFSGYLTNKFKQPAQEEVAPTPPAIAAQPVALPPVPTPVHAQPSPVISTAQPAPARSKDVVAVDTPATVIIEPAKNPPRASSHVPSAVPPAIAVTPIAAHTTEPLPALTPSAKKQTKSDAGKLIADFLGENLDTILAPLDKNITQPKTKLLILQGQFVAENRTAPDSARPHYQAALAVCMALSRAMDERDKALASLSHNSSIHPTTNLHETRYAGGYYYHYPYYYPYSSSSSYPSYSSYHSYPSSYAYNQRESERLQDRRTQDSQSEAKSRADALWLKQSIQLRENIQQLYLRVIQ